MTSNRGGTNNGPWQITARRTAFENPWIKIDDHKVIHPDNSPGEYGVVRFKNLAIGVLPINDEGYTWLVGQHRFPHDAYSWELPEGGGPVGIDPAQSARRELEEETGLRASNWEELCRFDISNSVTDEKAVCFLAWGLSAGAASPEPSEALKLKKVRFNELLDMVVSGKITDSLTIVMTLTAHTKALRGDAPAPISQFLLASSNKA